MITTNYKIIKSIYKDYVIIYLKNNKYIYLDSLFSNYDLDKLQISYMIYDNHIEIIKIKKFMNNQYFYYLKRLELIHLIRRIHERLY